MTDTPNETPPPAEAELVDTTPAAPERAAVTYGILFLVLAALAAYFLVHALRTR
jgi:hypothetical protein